MQVTEIKSEGLYREYRIVLAGEDISTKYTYQLEMAAQQMKVPGFRPGKVPLALVKKKYGHDILKDVVQEKITEAVESVLEEKKIRPAMEPSIQHKDDALEVGKDVEVKVSLEVYPEIPSVDFEKITVKKSVVDLTEEDLQDALNKLRKAHCEFVPVKAGRAAAKGDTVDIDFVGKIKGVAFEGGTAEKIRLELGAGRFIPGYEDQLIGVKKGDEKIVKVTFPKDYGSQDLAGKDAEFEVKVNDVLEAVLPEINEEFSKGFGFDTVEDLNKAVEEQVKKDFEKLIETKLKKELFDELDKLAVFEIPSGMLEAELSSLRSAEKEESELEALAARRIRLGLLLADLGEKRNIQVTENELRKAVLDQAKMMPGREREVIEFYKKNAQMLNHLRGPVLEDKVVAYILDHVTIKEEKTSLKALTDFNQNLL